MNLFCVPSRPSKSPPLGEPVPKSREGAQRAEEEAQRAKQEAQRAKQEAQRANAAEAELVRLRMLLEKSTNGRHSIDEVRIR